MVDRSSARPRKEACPLSIARPLARARPIAKLRHCPAQLIEMFFVCRGVIPAKRTLCLAAAVHGVMPLIAHAVDHGSSDNTSLGRNAEEDT